MQAQFMVPMAISLGFGVVFATFITLVLVPAGYMIMEDMKGGLSAWTAGVTGFLRLVYGLEKAAEPSDTKEPEGPVDAAHPSTEKEAEPIWAGSTRDGKRD